MLHDKAVLCLAFSRDSELLASGCAGGAIKVWQVSTGRCLRKYPRAHSEGVSTLCFSNESTQLASGSFDGSVR